MRALDREQPPLKGDHSTGVKARIWNFWEINGGVGKGMEQLGGWRKVG